MTASTGGSRFGIAMAAVVLRCAWIVVLAFGLWQAASADTYSTPGTYSWTAPAGVLAVQVEAWGGGGGGGAASGANSGGGGGAGGQYALAAKVPVVPGNVYTIVVGAGGSGGTITGGSSSGNGSAGGDSSFGSAGVVSVMAKGGAGGKGANGAGVDSGGSGTINGGVGGTVYAGGDGASGTTTLWLFVTGGGGGGGGAGSNGAGGDASGQTGGTGTSVGGGSGGTGAATAGSGGNGSQAGGGGGGAFQTSNAKSSGGNGAPGQVVITVPARAPTATTGAASGLSGNSVTLNGTVSSNGATTTTYFDYGPTTSYGNRILATPASLDASASNTAISLPLSGLACNATYHFRAVATNWVGTSTGSDATFTTGNCSLTLTKTTSTTSASVGQYIVFTITAANPNASGDLGPLTVTDNLPTGLSYQSSYAEHGSVSLDPITGQTVTWNLQTLPGGSSESLTLVVIPTQKGSYTNSASSGSITATAPVVAIGGAYVHYRMDEAVGTWNGTTGEVADSGAKHLNGTRTNTGSTSQSDPITPSPTIASQYPSVTGGGFCNAGAFDGKTIVTVPHSDFFQFTTNMSSTAWVWPNSWPTGSSDLYSILSNDVNYEFHINQQGKLYWWFYLNGVATSMTSTKTIPVGQWTHVAITMDTTSAAKIYINGVLDSTMTLSGGKTLTANPCGFYLGGDITTSNPPGASCNLITTRAFQGKIDEAKIYDYTLGPTEITADMNQGRQCAGSYFDHIELDYDGAASTCASKTVAVKACMDSGCTSLYTNPVTVTLSPAGVWGTNPLTINGVGTALIDASKLGGAGTITIGTSATSPAGNNATVCYNNGSPSTCSVSVVVPASCPFDAVETSANPFTHLYTKLSGTQFNVDVLALNGNSLNYNFVGPVAVDLVDATTSSCPQGAGLTPAQTVNFEAKNFGRQIATFNYSDAWPNVRVRMKGGSPSVSGYVCSYDNFAVRPPNVNLATVEPMGTPPSPTDANTVKAGKAFTLRATGPASYNGTLTLDATRLTAQDPMNAAIASGGIVGTLQPASLTGNDTTTTGNASYTEVGYLYLANGAYLDRAFTAVDRANGDCVTTTGTGDPNLSNTLSGGQYGCDVGSAAASLGRFIPDHFNTVTLGTMDCPAGLTCPTGSGIAYSGQSLGPISSGTPPTVIRVPLSVNAAAAGGTTTQNYAGSFASDVTLAIYDALGSTATANASKGTLAPTLVAAASFNKQPPSGTPVTKTGGVAQPAPSFSFTNWPTTPTDIYFRATAAADAITSLQSPAANSVEGGIKIVTGRLKISNATGAETGSLPLPVPVEADFWSGLAWVWNSSDNVTSLNSGSINLVAPSAGQSVFGKTSVTDVTQTAKGKWTIGLSRPGAHNVGSVDLAIDLGNTLQDNSCLTSHANVTTAGAIPWLRGSWCSSITAGQADPSARATFGIYTPENRRQVHVRELY